jgi:hypothetical protein
LPLAEADLLAAVRACRARGDVVNALWLRSQMLRLVDEHFPKSDVPAEFKGDAADYRGAVRWHNFTASNSWRKRFCVRNNQTG